MKRLRKVINIIVWSVVAIYLAVIILLHIPFIQHLTGSEIAGALGKKLGTKVEVGSVDLGFLNRVVIDDVKIYDQQSKRMLCASRVSATIDIIPLFTGKVSVSSAQLFGLDANFYRKTADSAPNFQFALDSLSSGGGGNSKLDLRISSLVIRNGNVRWNVLSAPRTGKFDVNHLNVSNLSAHMLLNKLTNNNVDFVLKRLALNESSGLDLRDLSFKLKADDKKATVRNLNIKLPNTNIKLPEISANYRIKNKKLDTHSLRFQVKLAESTASPADMGWLEPSLRGFKGNIKLLANVSGSTDNVNVDRIVVESDDQSISVRGSGRLRKMPHGFAWNLDAEPIKVSADGISFVTRNLRKKNIEIPPVINRLGNVFFKGKASGQNDKITAEGTIRSGVGDLALRLKLDGKKFDVRVRTDGVILQRILDNNDFGMVRCDITAAGEIPSPFNFERFNVAAKGTVGQFDYRGYSYHNISVDGALQRGTFKGLFAIDDPNGKLRIDGMVNKEKVVADIDAQHVNLKRLKLTDALGDLTFGFGATANLSGKDLNHLNGELNVHNLAASDNRNSYSIDHLNARVSNNFRNRTADVEGDFGSVHLSGNYDYASLPAALQSVVGHHLPSLFASHQRRTGDVFHFNANLVNAELIRKLFNIPLSVDGVVSLDGSVNDPAHTVDMVIGATDLKYQGNRIRNARININTDNDALTMTCNGEYANNADRPLKVDLSANAKSDNIVLNGNWDFSGNKPLYGNLNANARLYRNDKNEMAVELSVLPSEEVFDTIHISVLPSHLVYSHNMLDIDHFEVLNGEQRVTVNGQTTGSENDSLLVDFANINLKYVLDLVGFNAVKFTGLVTGKGYVKSFFKSPKAYAKMDIDDFRFQDGEFGTLHANVNYDNDLQRISFTSVADDGPDNYTDINGYVSIKDNYLDIPMKAHNTKLQFIEGFAGNVMKDINATGTGWCRLFGDLSHINLEGDMYGNGDMEILQTKTVYSMRNALIHMIPNEMQFVNDSIYDKEGHLGIVNGALHHRCLHGMTFDIHVDAKDLMCLNLREFDDNTFRGVIYGTGSCDLIGRKNETTINAELTPNGKSYMEYDAGYSGSPGDNSFIHWNDVTPTDSDSLRYKLAVEPVNGGEPQDVPDIPSDFRMNLLINTTPAFTLRVLMDESTGDHMDFHGSGVVRATYYNKGAFQMFGNYDVDDGVYTMTIQNLVKKFFTFQPGSSIVFGGNPFDARLNLKAQYTVNGVSLSDLQLGRSFTSGNIRVNCLMNILGTPLKPNVTFDLDLPTLSTDAQQMVRSLINSEEDMNQQVLYLLAVGRFYNPGNNNAEIENNASQSRTSLAMQSVLSGTLSQQINNVLSSVIHNTNWNFGANIATGDEGWSDAEYEGLLSGRMFNNRLLFNGQFGYRDNVTTNNSSFIGDFDLRYLLTPNGSAAVRVYNQNNDRYFTRNSMTTQGIGFVLKKDFNGWKDLFHFSRHKKKTKKSTKNH